MINALYDPLGHSLQKRKQQISDWENSETFLQSPKIKIPERVKFPKAVQFWAACSNLDFNEVERLIQSGIDVNVAKPDGLTALHQACIDNALEMVKFLIQQKANVNLQDNEGWTPLHATAQCGYFDVAKFLIEHGADLSIVSYDSELALDLAQDSNIQKLLREKMLLLPIDVNQARNQEEISLFNDAKIWLEEQQNCIDNLSVDKEFIPFKDSRTGASALHIAAAKGYSIVLETLLQIPNMPIDSVDLDGWTPLHAAAHWNKEEAIRILVDSHASFDITTSAGQTVFDVADPNVVMLLKQLKQQSSLVKKQQNNLHSVQSQHSDDKIGGIDEDKTLLSPMKSILKNFHNTQDGSGVSSTSGSDLVKRRVEDEFIGHSLLTEQLVSSSVIDDSAYKTPSKQDSNSELDCILARQIFDKKSPKLTTCDLKPPTKVSNIEYPVNLADSMNSESLLKNRNRISIVMAPEKSDETETQRSLKARHLRSTRRSTQGVNNGILDEAKKRAEKEDPVKVDINAKNDRKNEPTIINDDARTQTRVDPIINDTDNSNNQFEESNFDSNTRNIEKRQELAKNTNSVKSVEFAQNHSHDTKSLSLTEESDNKTKELRMSRFFRPPSCIDNANYPSKYEYASNDTPFDNISSSASINTMAILLKPSTSPNLKSNWRDSNRNNSSHDYKRLFEEERLEKDRLRRILEMHEKEIQELKVELFRGQVCKENWNCVQRKANLSSEEFKNYEAVKSQNIKLKEENAALVRVISKLSKPI